MNPAVRKTLRTLAVLGFWLLVWGLAAAAVGQELLLPSPLQTGRKLLELGSTTEFWITVGKSVARVLTGTLTAVLLSVLL